VLTYIGFDAISTLSEEVHNPRRNILLGTVLVCLVTGILSAIEVYAAQIVWPHGEKFPDVDTAYVHVAGRAGFGSLDPRTLVPRNNVLIIGAVALTGAFLITYGLGAELLNFGAFIGFIGVNASALTRYWIRAEEKKLINLLPPLLGIVICGYMWWSLRWPAKIVGFTWLTIGILYGAYKTKGFRRDLVKFEAPPE
jgi:amino acid transporter